MAETVSIRSASLTAEIAPLGAELQVLKSASGRDYLWDGDPAFWRGRSPLLFPIVGKVPNDEILVDGKRYPMRQHGIARTLPFALVEAGESECLYRLASSIETRAAYPFDFTLDMRYALAANRLTVTATVTNKGAAPMPMSFGYHPAFRWPLPGGGARAEHVLVFDAPEPAPIRRLSGGALGPDLWPTPVEGKVLRLADELFTQDAVIFDQPVSRAVTLTSPGGPSVRVDYPQMPHLGIWSKPGAGFVCIEPWHGYAAPLGFAGELSEKEGGINLAGGGSAEFVMAITVTE